MEMSRRRFCELGAGIAAGSLLALGVSGCGSKQADSLPQNSYDWGNLSFEDGRASYVDGEGNRALIGIDVSEHAGSIDWNQVAADGIDFAIIRVGNRGYTEGKLYDDEMFVNNIEGALEAGLPVGAYFFSQAITTAEAREEADKTLAAIEGYNVTFPVVFDYERVGVENERIDTLSIEERTKITQTFCDCIQKKGYTPLVYGNAYWFSEEVDLASLITDYDIWLAEYDAQPEPTYRFTMWQYTDNGKVAGTDGVDMNLCFVDYSHA